MDKIQEKIRKLLALSCSGNENEAATALKKANELLFKHNLDYSDIKQKDNKIIRAYFDSFNKAVIWKSIIMDKISEYNFCQTFTGWNPETNYSSKCFIICGSKHNIEAVKIMYEYLVEVVERLSRNYHRKLGKAEHKRSIMNSYRKGICFKIASRLEQMKIKAMTEGLKTESFNCNALVAKSLYEKEFCKIRESLSDLKIRSNRQKISYTSANALQHGMKDGEEINLNSQLTGNSQEVKHLNGSA